MKRFWKEQRIYINFFTLCLLYLFLLSVDIDCAIILSKRVQACLKLVFPLKQTNSKSKPWTLMLSKSLKWCSWRDAQIMLEKNFLNSKNRKIRWSCEQKPKNKLFCINVPVEIFVTNFCVTFWIALLLFLVLFDRLTVTKTLLQGLQDSPLMRNKMRIKWDKLLTNQCLRQWGEQWHWWRKRHRYQWSCHL